MTALGFSVIVDASVASKRASVPGLLYRPGMLLITLDCNQKDAKIINNKQIISKLRYKNFLSKLHCCPGAVRTFKLRPLQILPKTASILFAWEQ